MTDELDIALDITYALGEIQNIQSELELNWDVAKHFAARLEGVEARLGFLADALYEYLRDAASNPTAAAVDTRDRLVAEFAEDIAANSGLEA